MSEPQNPQYPGGPGPDQQGNQYPPQGDDGKTEVVNLGGPPPADPTTVTPAPGVGTPPGPGGYGAPGTTPFSGPQPPPGPGYGAPQPPDAGQYNPTQQVPSSYGQAYGAGAGQGQPGAYGGGYSSAPQGYPPQGSGPQGQQNYGGQPGSYGAGDQFSQMSGTKSNKGLRTALFAGGGVLLLIAIILLVTAFLVPGWAPKNLDQTAAEEGVTKVLTEDYQASDVSDVSCPSGQRVESGASFTCDVNVGGQAQTVTVTFLDDDGTYEVARPTS